MSRLATALFFAASLCLAQSPSTDPLLSWLDRLAQQQLDERERAIAAIRTQADAERRRKGVVRAKLTEIIGGLPTYSGLLTLASPASFTPIRIRLKRSSSKASRASTSPLTFTGQTSPDATLP